MLIFLGEDFVFQHSRKDGSKVEEENAGKAVDDGNLREDKHSHRRLFRDLEPEEGHNDDCQEEQVCDGKGDGFGGVIFVFDASSEEDDDDGAKQKEDEISIEDEEENDSDVIDDSTTGTDVVIAIVDLNVSGGRCAENRPKDEDNVKWDVEEDERNAELPDAEFDDFIL